MVRILHLTVRRVKPRTVLLSVLAALLGAAIACGGDEIVEKIVVQTVIVEKQVAGETVKVVETVIVEKPVTRIEKVVQTVIVEKQVPGEKVVETVVVEKLVIEKVVTTVVVEREKVVVATPTPGAAVAAAPRAELQGTIIVARGGMGPLNALPRACPGGCEDAKIGLGAGETLLVNTGAGEILPRLATAWELSSDQKFLDFKLRKGVPFQRGWGEMTAEDVVFSFNEANPNVTEDTINDQAAEIGASFSKTEALDKYTARFFVGAAGWRVDNIPLLFTPLFQSIVIYPKAQFDAQGVDGMKSADAEKMSYTGPFMMTKFSPQIGVTLEAVPGHWRQTPKFAILEMKLVRDRTVLTGLIETGQVDVARDVPFKELPRLKEKGLVIQQVTGLTVPLIFAGNYWVDTHPITGEKFENPGFDPSVPWVGDPEDPVSMENARLVRQAMSRTINREAVAEAIYAGIAKPAYKDGVSIDSPFHKDRWVVPYDPEKARELLAEAGYPNGFKGQQYFVAAPGGRELGEALIVGWRTDLGLELTLNTEAYQSYRAKAVNREVNHLISQSTGDSQLSFPFDIPKGKGHSSLAVGGLIRGALVPKWDEILIAMGRTPDLEERRKLAEAYYDYNHEWMVKTAIVEVPMIRVYNPERILSWPVVPGVSWTWWDTINLENADVVVGAGR